MREKQIERTRNAIVEGFIRLLEQKSFENITVQNIADAAPIARSSFTTISTTNTRLPSTSRTAF